MDNAEPLQDAKQFRINAKKFFITYPRCSLEPSVVLDFLKTKGRVVRYVVATEEHKEADKDGCDDRHIHACVEYSHKMNIKDPRAFDIGDGYHPNVQSVRNWAECSNYCRKEGRFIEEVSFDDSNPEKYRNRKADMQAWLADKEAAARRDVVWPIILPDRSEYVPVGKRRHLWVVGPPDSGKSTWAMNTFEGTKVYLRSPTNYPFESYKGETVIIYDDIYPTQEEWLNITNLHWNNTCVYGPTRYKEVYWPNKVDLVIIVLSNIMPNYTNQGAFDARFNVINMQ